MAAGPADSATVVAVETAAETCRDPSGMDVDLAEWRILVAHVESTEDRCRFVMDRRVMDCDPVAAYLQVTVIPKAIMQVPHARENGVNRIPNKKGPTTAAFV
jgi:hypothetical protein